jgi:hypothetical protein
VEIPNCLKSLAKKKVISLKDRTSIDFATWFLPRQVGIGAKKEGLSPDKWMTFYGKQSEDFCQAVMIGPNKLWVF